MVPAGERGVAVVDIPPEPVHAPRVAQIMRNSIPNHSTCSPKKMKLARKIGHQIVFAVSPKAIMA